jgi:hypothetical protein
VSLGLISLLFIDAFVLVKPQWTLGSEKTFDVLSTAALLPPALLGTLGLALLAGPSSQLIVLLLCAGAYAYLIMRFFLNPASLSKDASLIYNARALKLPRNRFVWIVLGSKVGGTLCPALVGLYFLWIEDGIQVTILGSSSNLASQVRGLKLSPLSSSVYAGSLMAFVVWAILAVAVYASARYRFSFVRLRLSRLLLLVLAFTIMGSCSHRQAAFAQSVVKSGGHKSICQFESIDSELALHSAQILQNCSLVQIREIVVNSAAEHVVVPPGVERVQIGRLTFAWPSSTLYIEGAHDENRVAVVVSSLDNSEGSTMSELHFANISLSTLSVTGHMNGAGSLSGETGPSIVFMTGSSVQDLHLHSLVAPNIEIRVSSGRPDSIHLEDVTANSLFIHSDMSDGMSDDYDDAAGVQGTAILRPVIDELTMTDVLLRGSDSVPARLALEGVTMVACPIFCTSEIVSVARKVS